MDVRRTVMVSSTVRDLAEHRDAVLHLQPRNVAALYNRAILREQRGDNDGAVADLEHALGEVSAPQERASIEAHLRRLRGSER